MEGGGQKYGGICVMLGGQSFGVAINSEEFS